MKELVSQWLKNIKETTLTNYEVQISYNSVFRAQLNYPMPCMTTTEFEIKTLFKQVFKLLLNYYGASKTFPLSLRHASTQFLDWISMILFLCKEEINSDSL